MWYLYVLLCSNNTFYTGITNDLDRRFKTHQAGRGARYTKIYPPIKIIYTEDLPDHKSAIKRELEVKSWSRQQKIIKLSLQTEAELV